MHCWNLAGNNFFRPCLPPAESQNFSHGVSKTSCTCRCTTQYRTKGDRVVFIFSPGVLDEIYSLCSLFHSPGGQIAWETTISRHGPSACHCEASPSSSKAPSARSVAFCAGLSPCVFV